MGVGCVLVLVLVLVLVCVYVYLARCLDRDCIQVVSYTSTFPPPTSHPQTLISIPIPFLLDVGQIL